MTAGNDITKYVAAQVARGYDASNWTIIREPGGVCWRRFWMIYLPRATQVPLKFAYEYPDEAGAYDYEGDRELTEDELCLWFHWKRAIGDW